MHKFMSMGSGKVSVLVLAVLVAVVSSGCEPLRKKFIRQKKKDATASTESIPVLEPEAYPDKAHDPAALYRHHYGLWSVWYKDYLSILEEDGSDKRQTYVLNQMDAQLEQMAELLPGEKKQELTKLRSDLNGVLEIMETPAVMRQESVMIGQMRSIDRRLRNNFKFEHVKDAWGQ